MDVKSLVADTGFLVALYRRGDQFHSWASAAAMLHPPPWLLCEAVWSETEFLLEPAGKMSLHTAFRRGALKAGPALVEEAPAIIDLLEKYSDVPMSFADACIVRLSEILPDPLVLTTDSHFKIYRRHSRKVVPCLLP